MHYEHIIDGETGEIIGFVDPEFEILQRQIATWLGCWLVHHRLDLHCPQGVPPAT